ncbi:helix-turn-helix domain-containing protein [Mycolicibacterium thermoresistibile]|uniref:Helix-turn-helix domain-containing protein n=2 Tax=Mycolicibacterium thermoresistibile TaxID=1797 RepID=G7CB90_MYCT3|nr:helix-turn-helix domain-containing protein [Mycolicibacterium thermoresistibile]EHI14763.1 hypothetical protein KEK_01160 [Mycolicibacterium thermoresistibile ATCC 19527]MCV7186858.1 helix-turn-helix domain-containing protein [Mycolicibacterium thermoresistibile]GAT16051.1 putative uncharacterized protein [Mycolicibacterium thermoresistibile]SNW18696.1 DNA binding domain, excisionase family [Mycolicibacterium thermoresistibile]
MSTKTDQPNDGALTTTDLARALGCHKRTIQRAIIAGRIPAFKLRGQWRIRRVDADSLMYRLAGHPDNPPTPLGDAK